MQTVIRRFGGKQGLLAVAARREAERVRRQRDQAPVGDLPGTIRNLVDHYEELGLPVLRLLAQEDRSRPCTPSPTRGAPTTPAGASFAPTLAGLRGAQRSRRLAQLIAVTDMLTWKLLRHDRQLGRRQTELALIELLEPSCAASATRSPCAPWPRRWRRCAPAASTPPRSATGSRRSPTTTGAPATRAALARAVRVFARRAEHDAADLRRAIDQERPDALLVDVNAWGAAAAAEAWAGPWATFCPTRCRCAQPTRRRSGQGCRPAGRGRAGGAGRRARGRGGDPARRRPDRPPGAGQRARGAVHPP